MSNIHVKVTTYIEKLEKAKITEQNGEDTFIQVR